jgi:hypothetical protein
MNDSPNWLRRLTRLASPVGCTWRPNKMLCWRRSPNAR